MTERESPPPDPEHHPGQSTREPSDATPVPHARGRTEDSGWQLRQAMNAALNTTPALDEPAKAAGVYSRPPSSFPKARSSERSSSQSSSSQSSSSQSSSSQSSSSQLSSSPTLRNALNEPSTLRSTNAANGWPRERVIRVAKMVLLRSTQVGLALALLGIIAVFFVVRHYEANLPSVEQLKAGYDPPQVTRVLARDGTVLANLFTERRTVVPFADIPSHVKQAFLAAEDASFYEHEGLDYLGMLRAMVANLKAGKTTQGGSTITQQVIKNVLLDSERSYRRKIRETILARRVEQHLTKDEIFGLYLNHIYLGHGRYGVEEASRYY